MCFVFVIFLMVSHLPRVVIQRFMLIGILLLGISIQPSFAQTPFVLSENFTSQQLGPYLEILADPEGQWTFEEVQHPQRANQFSSHPSPTLSFGNTHTVYWIRLTLSNPHPKDRSWILQYGNPQLDDLTLYRPKDEGGFQPTQVGNIFPFTNRDIQHHLFTFLIETPAAQEIVLYLRLNSNGKAMNLIFTLWSLRTFVEQGFYIPTLLAAHLLVIGLFFLYAIYGFISLRNISYFYFAMFTFGRLGTTLFQYGFDDFLLWTHPGQKAHYAFIVTIFITLIAGPQFVRHILKLPQHLPKGNRAVQGLLFFITLGLFGIWWFPLPWHLPFALSMVLLTNLLMLGLCILRIRQGFLPAFYVLAGILFRFMGIALVILAVRGEVGNPLLVHLGNSAVDIIVLFLLLMVLAAIYREERKEKEKERKEKEKAQAQAHQLQAQVVEELQRMDQLKDEFLANTSHELRTPLHGIIGVCDIMTKTSNPPLTPHQIQQLQLVTNGARRLASLVDDLLDFSKIKNQELQLKLGVVELQSTIRLVEQLCLPLLTQKPIHFFTQLPDESIWVRADENRLQQILLNLLSNAIKFTHEGQIEIRASLDFKNAPHSVAASPTQQVVAASPTQQVVIEVIDTGIGIPLEFQQHIFHPFAQTDSSLSREYGGTGLGLAITRQLVELHQGELQVESKEGHGSRFFFTLPLTSLESSQQTESVSPDSILHFDSPVRRHDPWTNPASDFVKKEAAPDTTTSSLEAPLILVVDDEPLNVEILKTALSQQGYRVKTAINGFQALDYLQQQVPSMILLDVMMPRLNGYEVCRQIRKHHNEAELPIIMLTAKSQVHDHVEGLQVGANDYLTKPFYAEELLARVRSQLQQKRAGEVLQEMQRLQWEVERARQVEAGLRVSEQRLSKLLDVVNEAVLAVNEAGQIMYCNQLFHTWLHYTKTDLAHQSVTRLIPPDTLAHPLNHLTMEHEINDSASPSAIEHYSSVFLQDGHGNPWEGQMWQTFLELEEVICVLTFIPRSTDPQPKLSVETPQWVGALNRNRARLQQLIDTLADLHPADLQSHPFLLKELTTLDEALAHLVEVRPPDNPEERFKHTLVEVMNESLRCWEAATQTSSVDLAEASGLWTLYTEENRVRARTLERYLQIKQLPKKPRWRVVVQTAHFVLSHCSLPAEARSPLETSLNRLLHLIHQRNLSYHAN